MGREIVACDVECIRFVLYIYCILCCICVQDCCICVVFVLYLYCMCFVFVLYCICVKIAGCDEE